MSRRRKAPKALPTIWRVPDDLWERIEPLLAELDAPQPIGRPRIDARAALDAILYRMRSGVQWNQLPAEFPDDSSVHRTFQRWRRLGVFDRVWAAVLCECEELGGVDWEWQAADTARFKARLGGPDWAQPHRPGQSRDQRLAAGRGGRRSAGGRGSGSERARHKTAGADPPSGRRGASRTQRGEPAASLPRQSLRQPHRLGGGRWVRLRAAHPADWGAKTPVGQKQRYPKRRWVVERTLAWLSKCRAILIRYDKQAANYLALIKLACALLWYCCWRRLTLLR